MDCFMFVCDSRQLPLALTAGASFFCLQGMLSVSQLLNHISKKE